MSWSFSVRPNHLQRRFVDFPKAQKTYIPFLLNQFILFNSNSFFFFPILLSNFKEKIAPVQIQKMLGGLKAKVHTSKLGSDKHSRRRLKIMKEWFSDFFSIFVMKSWPKRTSTTNFFKRRNIVCVFFRCDCERL